MSFSHFVLTIKRWEKEHHTYKHTRTVQRAREIKPNNVKDMHENSNNNEKVIAKRVLDGDSQETHAHTQHFNVFLHWTIEENSPWQSWFPSSVNKCERNKRVKQKINGTHGRFEIIMSTMWWTLSVCSCVPMNVYLYFMNGIMVSKAKIDKSYTTFIYITESILINSTSWFNVSTKN